MRPTDLILRDTVQVILNADGSNANFPDSTVLNMMGLGTVFPVADGFGIAPTLDFYSAYYAWTGTRAIALLDEERTAVVYGAILDIPVTYQYDFNPVHRLTVSGGPAFAIRAAARAKSVPVSEQPSVDAIINYQWSKGRFFYPEIGLSYSFSAAQWVRFGATARVMLPVFNWWTAEGISWGDNMIVGGGIWLSFSDFWRNLDLSKLFKKTAKVAPLSPEAQAKAQDGAKAEEPRKTEESAKADGQAKAGE
jgi:hypothetical protein